MRLLVLLLILGSALLPTPAHAVDSDNDGLSDDEEVKLYRTDPLSADTDGDSFADGEEVMNGYSPLVAIKKLYEVDSDRDKLNDLLEIAFKTNLYSVDTDMDAETDYEEIMRGMSPVSSSSRAVLSRYIETDLTTQTMRYVVDEKLIYTFPISSGNPHTPTPVGSFKIMYKVPKMRYRGADYDLPNVKWNMAFKRGGYFIHTAYWHNNFGKKTNSHGCINMREADAALLYKYLDVGTEVRVVGKTPPNRTVK